MKRLLWVFWFVGLVVGKLSHAHIKATDLSGCEPAVASYEPADISLAAFVSHLATANIDSTRKFTKFIKEFPDILQDKPLRRYPELQEQWDILWDRVRKKQLENLSEFVTHLNQPEPSDEDSRINGHENQEFFADEAPVDAGNWIENKINEQDKHFNELSQEERDWRKNGKIGEYWQAIDEESDAANYDSPEGTKEIIVALLNLNPKMDMQELADKSGVDHSQLESLIEELQNEKRIGWIDDNSDGFWLVLNERNYDKWIRVKVSALLIQHPRMTRKQLSEATGIPFSEISKIVKELRKATILASLIKNPSMSKSELSDTLGLRVKQISYTIDELKEEKRSAGKVNGTGGHWEVFDKNGRLISYNPQERRRETILALWAENPYLTIQNISDKTDISVFTVTKIAEQLQNEGLLIHQGNGPAGYWATLNKEDESTSYDPHKWKEEIVLDLLTDNPKMTTQELATALGFTDKNVAVRTTKKLQDKGLLQRIGSNRQRQVQWRVLREGVEPIDYIQEREQTVLNLFRENPYITKGKVAKKLGIAVSTTDIIIRTLKNKGLLQRFGDNRSGYWQVSQEPMTFLN